MVKQVEPPRRRKQTWPKEFLHVDPETGVEGPHALAIALAHAEHLGPEFSSEDPHGSMLRGDNWLNED